MLMPKKIIRKTINIENIKVKSNQMKDRELNGAEEDNILLKSIKATGQPIQDIIVRPIPTVTKKFRNKRQYYVVVGVRRLQALKKSGKKMVSVIVIYNLTDLEVMALSFAENRGRKDYSDYQIMQKVMDWLKLLINSKKTGNETKEEYMRIRRESIQEIADNGFAGKKSDVYRILQTSSLPTELQTFIKTPKERTKKEENFFKKLNIKQNFKMDFKTIGILEKIFENLDGGAPPSEKTEKEKTEKEKTEKIFDLIQSFGLDHESYKKRNRILRRVRDQLKQKSYENVKSAVKKEMNISSYNLEPARFIHYEIPNQYMNLHVKAIKLKNIKSTTLARKVYLQWLESMAEQDDKLQELELELNRLKCS